MPEVDAPVFGEDGSEATGPMTPPTDTLTSKKTAALSDLTADLIRECLDRLRGPESLGEEETVHLLRVATKRLRAAWRLAGDVADAGFASRRRKTLRNLSGLLSKTRDAAVLAALARNLANAQTDGRIAMALDTVGNSLRKFAGAPPAEEHDSTGIFRSVRQMLDEELAAWHSLDDIDPARLRRAARHRLRKSMNHARHDARLAQGDSNAELWHDWRKTVKRLRYQREFVAAAQGREPGKFDARINRLGSRLGDRNDLANLTAYVEHLAETDTLSRKEYGLVRKAITAEESHLMRNCRRLGRKALLS